MKSSSKNVLRLVFVFFMFFYSYCSNQNLKKNFLRKLQPPFEDRFAELEKEEQKLMNDYKEKMEENNLLKKQIEKNIKYIKILLTTGIIMFLIIVFTIIKLYLNCKKNNLSQIDIKSSLRNAQIGGNKISLQNQEPNKVQISSSSTIAKSSYNLLDSEKSVNISSHNISISELNNSSNNNNNLFSIEEKEKNYDAPNAPKIEDYSNIVINDDNRTLTNNPDIFLPSRMDKILYKPYSKEEIK